MPSRTCVDPLAPHLLMHPSSSGYGCIPSSPTRMIARKLRGFCDGYTCGGQTMVHGATYEPTPQHIDVCFQIALLELICMYILHTGVINAFAVAERPDQIYYMRWDNVFGDWWADKHPDIPLPPDAVVHVLKNLQCRPACSYIWAVRCHTVFLMLKFKNTTHDPCLYNGTFNYEFVLFL
jgi:hypothetical protein